MDTNKDGLGDVSGGSVHFASLWRAAKEHENRTTQTNSVDLQSVETQTGGNAEISTQTDELDDAPGSQSGDPWNHDANLANSVRFNGNLMLRELSQSQCSAAFLDYEPLAEDEEQDIVCKYVLKFDAASYFKTSKGLQCTGLSWNVTGSIIAASYGRFDHSGWCDYRGCLCLWNLFGNKFRADRPDVIYEASSGLMCVACHPENPAIVASGSYNGELIVWNSTLEETLLANSKIDDYFHREPVVKIEWVYDMKERDYQIASVSGDGKILMWSLKNKLSAPIQGFRLAPRDRSLSVKKDNGKACLGGTAVAFPFDTKVSGSTGFVVGSEGGQLFRCAVGTNTSEPNMKGGSIKWSKNAEAIISRVPEQEQSKLRRHVEEWAKEMGVREVSSSVVFDSKPKEELLFSSPIESSFQSHIGPINAVQFAPFHRSLFLTCGSDGSLRVYSVLQSKAIIVLDPAPTFLFSAAWSRTRPMVLAAVAEDGKAYIYDLLANQTQPAAVLSPAAEKTKKPVAIYAISFNPKVRDFVATGNAEGTIHIWQVNWRLSNLQGREQARLDFLARKAMVGDTADNRFADPFV